MGVLNSNAWFQKQNLAGFLRHAACAYDCRLLSKRIHGTEEEFWLPCVNKEAISSSTSKVEFDSEEQHIFESDSEMNRISEWV